jgi:hypothetical protein
MTHREKMATYKTNRETWESHRVGRNQHANTPILDFRPGVFFFFLAVMEFALRALHL